MKIIIILTMLGMLVRFLVVMPSAQLPPERVMGTEQIMECQEEAMPEELRYMSKKMYYLKTGRSVNNETNHKYQQNFWGKGAPARTQFPSHLAEWEKTRRTGKSRRS
ncbi:hypothetical protein ACFL5C_00010 [Candidatus Omnitrophota bacterium]